MAFEYAPAPESRSVVDIAPSYGLFIDGEFREASDGKVFKTVSPSTEEVLSEVAQASAEDVDAAVKAARKAFEKWSALPGSERAKYLFRIARIIQERSRELAVLETLDNGKPIKETRDADLPLVAAHFFYYAGWADKLGHAGFGANPKPLGVAGQVIPWNFPLLMLAWKIAPALAAGNTVVLKPAETTPLSALFFADICRQAGLPKGVVNILTGDGTAGAALVAHDGIDKVAFTGSTAVGKAIARTVAGTDKRLSLELGGKGANIVFDDAPHRPGRRGHRQRDLLQPGAGLLRRVAPSGAGVHPGRAAGRAQAADVHAPRGRPARQEHRRRCHQLRRAAGPHHRAGRQRRGRGCRALGARVRAAGRRLLVRPDDLHERHSGAPHRPRGDLRPRAVGAELPYARRGRRQGQQLAVRAVG
ncbi:hypothetical protein GCM10020000_30560 [Streptomyces olivoverticillatus]